MPEFEPILVGTYTDRPSQSRGIVKLSLDVKTGRLTTHDELFELRNPSYLTQTPNGVYSFNELSREEGAQLHFHASQADQSIAVPIAGDHPCHIDWHKQYLALANYGSGNVVVYLLDDFGEPREMIADLFQAGHGPNSDRQQAPHAHQVTFLKHTNQMAVVDLGSDRVHIYDYDTKKHRFYLEQSVVMPAGSGPRHLVFNRAETRAYVVCELSETLVMISKSDDQWSIESQMRLLPQLENGQAAAAVRLTQDDRHLYVSCRAQNKIVQFDVSGDEPVWLDAFDCGGAFPRDFTLSSDEQWVIVANQHSANVVSYRRDLDSGALSASGFECHVDQPVCLLPVGVL